MTQQRSTYDNSPGDENSYSPSDRGAGLNTGHVTDAPSVRAGATAAAEPTVAARSTRNLGVTEAEAETLLSDRAGAQFTTEAFVAAGGPGWNSTALTDRDRSIAVIAALVGQHVTDDRLTPYLGLARRSGVDEQGLAALMVLLAAYLGQPATSMAMAAVRGTAPG